MVEYVPSLVACVYESITTADHEFEGGFAVLPFLADVFTAGAIVPNPPFVG